MITGIIFLVLLTVVMIFFLRTSKEEKKDHLLQQKRLEDESIYDPETGVKITLDQIEEGVSLKGNISRRIKSDEEIENNYTEDDKEIEYIKRDFIKLNCPEVDTDGFSELINQSYIFKQFKSANFSTLWKLNAEVLIGIVYISNTYFVGKGYQTFYEYQLAAVIQKISGQHDLDLQDYDKDIISNIIILKHQKKATYKSFRDLMDTLNKRLRIYDVIKMPN